MTDLSGLTPGEQVRALGLAVGLAVGDTIEGRWEYDGEWLESRRKLLAVGGSHCLWRIWSKSSARPKWICEGEDSSPISNCDWRKISSDPSIDPAEPLRRELREAHRHIEDLYRTVQGCTCDPRDYEVEAWLARNAAFGAGEEGE